MRSWRLAAALFWVFTLILSAGVVSAETKPPLVQAAIDGQLEEVVRLLAQGADPDAHDGRDNTGLIFAARDGYLDIAKVLIEAGASVDWIDAEGVTPLILASFKEHVGIVVLLLRHNADQTVRDQWGRSALDYALRRGEGDDIAILLMGSQQ